jgi:hypothetical protein
VLKIAYTTQENIKVPLLEWAGTVTDPTTLDVELAIITGSNDPAEGDWVTAAWVTEADPVSGADVVKAEALWQDLVAVPAARTSYTAWMRVTAAPEVVVLHCGTIQTR